MFDQWIERIIHAAHKYPRWRYCLLVVMAIVYAMRCVSDLRDEVIIGYRQVFSRLMDIQLIRKSCKKVFTVGICLMMIMSLGPHTVKAAEELFHIDQFGEVDESIRYQQHSVGSEYDVLDLPQTLSTYGYVVNNEMPAVEPIEEIEREVPVLYWISMPEYSSEIAGEYVFSPVFDKQYEVDDELSIVVQLVMIEEDEVGDGDKQDASISDTEPESSLKPLSSVEDWLTEADQFPDLDTLIESMPDEKPSEFFIWLDEMKQYSVKADELLADYELFAEADKLLINEELIKILSQWQAMQENLQTLNQINRLQDAKSWTDHVTTQPEGYKVSGDTITISSADGLAWLASVVNGLNSQPADSLKGKTVKLNSDIDLSAYQWVPIGTYDNRFYGVFDGNNYTIKNMKVDIHKPEFYDAVAGFFGAVGSTGVVKNITLDANSSIIISIGKDTLEDYDLYVGGIVGVNSGTIDHCINYASITAAGGNPMNAAGGIAGDSSEPKGIIRNCINYGNIQAHYGDYLYSVGFVAGGIIGVGGGGVGGGNVENCANYGHVSISVRDDDTLSEYQAAGGLIGQGSKVNIINSFNYGNVEFFGTPSNSEFASTGTGALIGIGTNPATSSYYLAGRLTAYGDKDDNEEIKALSEEQFKGSYLIDSLNKEVNKMASRNYYLWSLSNHGLPELNEAWKPKADAPTNLQWSGYSAIWKDSTNSNKFNIQLYKQNNNAYEPIGEMITFNGKSYNYQKLILDEYGPGNYAFKIKVLESSNYWESDWSEMSSTYEVGAVFSFLFNDTIEAYGTSFAQIFKIVDPSTIKKMVVTRGAISSNEWISLLNYRESLSIMTDFEISNGVTKVEGFPDEKTVGTGKLDNGYFPASIKNIKIPKLQHIYSYTTIGTKGTGCQELESVEFVNVTYIRTNLFKNCTQLRKANFPKASTIDTNAFENCSNLTITDFSNVSTINSSAFKNSGLIEVKFPRGTSIMESAFENCSSLKKISFPLSYSQISGIGSRAFANCSSLEVLEMIKTAPTKVAEDAFIGCPKKRKIQFVNSVKLLTGKDLIDAQNNYKAVKDDDIEDNLWYGWKIYDIVLPEVSVDVTYKKIYAMGNPIVVVEGTNPSLTNIYVDKNENKIKDEDESYIKIGDSEPTDVGYDLSEYSVVGTGNNWNEGKTTKLYGDVSVTMLGGKILALFGNVTNTDDTFTYITGDMNIVVRGGIIQNAIYIDNMKSDKVYMYMKEDGQIYLTIAGDAVVHERVQASAISSLQERTHLWLGDSVNVLDNGILFNYNSLGCSFDKIHLISPLSSDAEVNVYMSLAEDDKMLPNPVIADNAVLSDAMKIHLVNQNAEINDYEVYYDQQGNLKSRKYIKNALNLPLTQEKIDEIFGKDKAELSEEMIIIKEDVKLDETINIGIDITIDLNGHEIKGPMGQQSIDEGKGKPAFSLAVDNSTLTIIDRGGNGSISGGNGANGTADNQNGGAGGSAIDISKVENGTLNLDGITVNGGNGGNAYVDGNSGKGGSGADTKKNSKIDGSGTMNGGNGGNIPPSSTGVIGDGGQAITGDGTVNGDIIQNSGLKGVRIIADVDASKAGTQVEVSEDELKDAVITESERKNEKITKIEVVLKVEKKEDEPNKEIIENITSELNTEEIGAYFDISLSKTIIDNQGTENKKITESERAFEIRITIPDSIKNGTNYQIIRVHNHQADALPTRQEGYELIFKSDKFSTYAIAYTPIKNESSSSSGNSHIADIKNGRIYDGYMPVASNQWVIVNESGKIIKKLKSENFNQQYNNEYKVYYVGEDGKLVSSWKFINNHWYYFNQDHTAKMNGWIAHYNDWYYFRDYQMVTNEWYATDHGRWYYLLDSGKMARSQSIDHYWINNLGIYWGIDARESDRLLFQ